MAFVIAGLILVVTLAVGAVGLMADMMSDATGQRSGVGGYVIFGVVLSALIAGSHWLPPIGW